MAVSKEAAALDEFEPEPGLEEQVQGTGPRITSDRAALAVFVVGLVVGAIVLLAHLGRYRWFLGDEWEFLADREIGDVRDWFRAHGGHWTTLPMLAYRALYGLFGLDYLPYQVLIVSLHVGTVALLRTAMRRVGVGPWMATLVALSLLLFGSGEDDILWAFQITFTGALFFGLIQLLLLDHDGPLDRRDWLGLAAGFLSIMCSGVGVAMVVAAAVAALIRRGPRVAAFHSIPLAGAYLTWWLIVRPPSVVAAPDTGVGERLRDLVEWNVNGVRGAFADYGYFTVVSIAIVVLLVFGLVLAWRGRPMEQLRVVAAAPVALLVGAVVFLTMTGWTRAALGSEQAAASRYVYIVIACALPALAVAADAIVQRWRIAVLPVGLLILAGIPGNVGRFGDHFPWTKAYFDKQQSVVLGMPRMPEADTVDPEMQPVQLATGLTIGWLLEELRGGRLPQGEAVGPLLANEMRARLSMSQQRGTPPGDCASLTRPNDVSLDAGEVVGIRNQPVQIELIAADGKPVPGALATYNPDDGELLVSQFDGLNVRFTGLAPTAALRFSPPPDEPAMLCR